MGTPGQSAAHQRQDWQREVAPTKPCLSIRTSRSRPARAVACELGAGAGRIRTLPPRTPSPRALKLSLSARGIHSGAVSKKSAKIAALIESCRGRDLDAHYLGYFACFNQGLFYESHDVLEELWLKDRHGPDGDFYKGLIQFAGAFVHLQKHSPTRPRLRPAAALLKLAQANLGRYPATHRGLSTLQLLELIEGWLQQVEADQDQVNPLVHRTPPQLRLLDETCHEG